MNIQLITNIYPLPKGNKGTSVCHFFTKEWVKMGYNVRVVHVQTVYPRFFYWIARLNAKAIASKTGAVVYTNRDKGGRYEMDGVSIMRYPLFKMVPHGKYVQKSVVKLIRTIIEENASNDYVPDVIVGHFLNPQLEVVSKLKETYTSAKTAIVMHGDLNQIDGIYGTRFYQYSQKIDKWGFRSVPLLRSFEKIVGEVKNPFFCFSGIPEHFLMEKCEKCFDGNLHRFIYVGEMIERKYPISVVKSINSVYPDKDFLLTYIGDGSELDDIKRYSMAQNIADKVVCKGKLPRQMIVDYLDDAECFIMISKGEAFGLVYLEAMSRGCITIASRGEGVDGIIIDGENGFLCKAGDEDELSSIIQRINHLSVSERKQISEKARLTVADLTDRKVAERYINDVIKN